MYPECSLFNDRNDYERKTTERDRSDNLYRAIRCSAQDAARKEENDRQGTGRSERDSQTHDLRLGINREPASYRTVTTTGRSTRRENQDDLARRIIFKKMRKSAFSLLTLCGIPHIINSVTSNVAEANNRKSNTPVFPLVSR